MDDLQALKNALLLNCIPGLGPNRQQALLEQFPLADIFQQDFSAFFPFPNKIRDALIERQNANHPDHDNVEQELERCDAEGIALIAISHPDYPALLQETVGPPLVLYVKGDVLALAESQLAIVGARKASQHALRLSYSWAEQLQSQGIHITSGLAEGIDAAAHQGALAGNGKTIAVLAHGLDSLYPKRHEALAQAIIENGALVSEFALGMKARREYFPRRNRIISGLSQATLVVEAAQKSGTLITARCAIEQNREVFAVPGMVGNSMTEGCHQLIKEGAFLADSAQSICEVMGWHAEVQLEKASGEASNPLLQLIPFEFTHLDVLAESSGKNSQQLSIELLQLEVQGLVENQAGLYRRIG
jgi:DNA processing protein